MPLSSARKFPFFGALMFSLGLAEFTFLISPRATPEATFYLFTAAFVAGLLMSIGYVQMSRR